MTTSTLKKKLSKMNILFSETDYNGYNKDICFSINGMNFCAGFNLTTAEKIRKNKNKYL